MVQCMSVLVRFIRSGFSWECVILGAQLWRFCYHAYSHLLTFSRLVFFVSILSRLVRSAACQFLPAVRSGPWHHHFSYIRDQF